MRVLLLALALAACSPAPPQPEAGAGKPTRQEAQSIVSRLPPAFVQPLGNPLSVELSGKGGLTINRMMMTEPKVGDTIRYGLFVPFGKDAVRVIDASTIIRTRTGNVEITITGAEPWQHWFVITDVIHRGVMDADWKIIHEHVSLWPNPHNDKSAAPPV